LIHLCAKPRRKPEPPLGPTAAGNKSNPLSIAGGHKVLYLRDGACKKVSKKIRSIRMSSRAERYRKMAADCELAAMHGRGDPETKAVYLELAQRWRELARQAEMLDRGDGPESDP
jgi:hypothetical protein